MSAVLPLSRIRLSYVALSPDSRAFMRFSSVERAIITCREHVTQRIPISAPIRVTSHSKPPHGCFFRSARRSPTLKVYDHECPF